jgi:DNA-binding transcriptional regulator YiaG
VNTESFYLTGEQVAKEPLRYRACGLEGIYILNGYTIEEHDGEEHVSVADIDGLHKAIGRHLVTHRKALSPREIKFLRNTMELTQAELADMLGNNSQSVARWEKGECEIPGTAEKLLRAIFLASLMTAEELESLRDLLTTKLKDLDTLDEVVPAPAQFELFGHWSERERVAA